MARWLYLFANNETFPEPLAEISALSALLAGESGMEREDAVYLLLSARRSPPLSTAQRGDEILLCTRPHSPHLIQHGRAVVAGEPLRYPETPPSVRDLYGQRENRMFLPISAIHLEREKPVEELTPLQLDQFARGQAHAKRVGPANRRQRAKKVEVPEVPPHTLIKHSFPSQSGILRTKMTEPLRFIGLDPTAGDWEKQMTSGRKKKMTAASLVLNRDGTVSPDNPFLTYHQDNESFWDRAHEVSAEIACIDGPCATNGPQVLPDWSNWDSSSPDGFREGERALAREGVSLFWTTKATVLGFLGASRWIARSLRLFQYFPNKVARIRKIETHPHGAFSFLWRFFGCNEPLPPKSTAAGRNARLDMLEAFIGGITKQKLPNHDAVDAVCATLVAILHYCRLTKAYGTATNGGEIWMPDPQSMKERGTTH